MYKSRKPFNTFYLDVGNDTFIFVKEYGNPNGLPVIVNHGGPGGAHTSDGITKRFYLKKTHLITYDQRGCGKSKPRLSIKGHTTNAMIEDIRKIKAHFQFDKFVIAGGSWGAMLSIMYTAKYPDDILYYIACSGCYFFDNTVWPREMFKLHYDTWASFCKLIGIPQKDIENRNISLAKQRKICKKYFEKIQERVGTAKRPNKYAIEWYTFEDDVVYICKQEKDAAQKDESKDKYKKKYEIAFYESYYYWKNFFTNKRKFQNSLEKMKHVPGHIIHGRMDVICDVNESIQLHKLLPKSKLHLVNGEGHGGKEQHMVYKDIVTKLAKKH
jgi:proline iminopeptidase